MIVDLPSSTTSAVNRKLVELRESGGVLALGRVLTLVIVTDDGASIEKAIEAGNSASREHPCRVIVLARGQRRAAPRLDAQIRVGGDAGASEVVVLRGYGQDTLTQPWNPYLPLVTFTVALLAAWAVVEGQTIMLLPLVASAYFLFKALATYPGDVATAAAASGNPGR